jgi:myo-inositol-1(or 4)-monophosphatase
MYDWARDELGRIEACVRQAGEMILADWDRPKDIGFKGRIDLVTKTDTAVEDYLTRELKGILPEAKVIAEERSGQGTVSDLSWVLDPLDGTTNFAHGLPHVAVSLALWAQDEIVLGLVYAPRLDEFFCAIRGNGAFLNQDRIQVSDSGRLDQSLVATGFPYSIAEDAADLLPPLGRVLQSARGLRRLGAASLDLAYTACGRLAGFYEYGLRPWDTAAGWLLVEEAGGLVTGIDGRSAYGLGPNILASNGRLHLDLARAIDPQAGSVS